MQYQDPMAKTCLDYALHYISRYPKTEKEMELQLMKKGYDSNDISQTLTELMRLGYLGDHMYTQLYLNSEVASKGKALYPIRQKLQQKGVDRSIIYELMQELEPELVAGQSTKIRQLIDKFASEGLEGVKIINKLASRGYHYDLIRKVIEARAEEKEI